MGTVVATQCEQEIFFKLFVLLPNCMPIKVQFPSFDEKFLSVVVTDPSVTVLSQLFLFVLTSKVIVIQITCSFCFILLPEFTT